MRTTFVTVRLHEAWNRFKTSLYSSVPAVMVMALHVVLPGMGSQCSGMSSASGINNFIFIITTMFCNIIWLTESDD